MKTLRIAGVAIPRNNSEARAFGLDLDGDKAIDNNAGLVSGALHSQIAGFDLSTAATTQLANVAWHIGVRECGDEAEVAIGPDADVLTGRISGSHIIATGRAGQMPISTLWDPTGRFGAAGWLDATHAGIDLVPLGDGRWEGRIAMGFSPAELIDAVVEPMAPYFDEHELFMEYLDVAPKDGRITVEEVKNANVTKSLLAPDLGPLGTSFAIAFTASELPAN